MVFLFAFFLFLKISSTQPVFASQNPTRHTIQYQSYQNIPIVLHPRTTCDTHHDCASCENSDWNQRLYSLEKRVTVLEKKINKYKKSFKNAKKNQFLKPKKKQDFKKKQKEQLNKKIF